MRNPRSAVAMLTKSSSLSASSRRLLSANVDLPSVLKTMVRPKIKTENANLQDAGLIHGDRAWSADGCRRELGSVLGWCASQR
jgi:hypothetical protein